MKRISIVTIISMIICQLGTFSAYASDTVIYNYYLNESFTGKSLVYSPTTTSEVWYLPEWHKNSGGSYSAQIKDGVLRFESDREGRCDVLLNRVIPKQTTIYFEADIAKNNDCGFYINFIPKADLKTLSDGTIRSVAQSYNSAVIGMNNKEDSTGSVWAPNLGYAQYDTSLKEFIAFKDESLSENDGGYYCNIPSDGAFHNLKMVITPVSKGYSDISVSVDNGKTFTANVNTDFFERRDTAAISILAHQIGNLKSDIAFDNVKVYTELESADSGEKVYFNENFNSYTDITGEVAPENWFRNSGKMEAAAGNSSALDDYSLKFSGSESDRATALLNSSIEPNTKFYMRFDVLKTNECGFYIHLIPSSNLKKTDTGQNRPVSNCNWADLTVGMTNGAVTGSERSPAPRFGYAQEAGTIFALTSFINSSLTSDDENYYCKIPADSAWHNVSIDFVPISSSSTNISVSVDNKSKYTALAPLDFFTNDISAISLLGHYNATVGSNSVQFDNIKIYSVTEEKINEELSSKKYFSENFNDFVSSANGNMFPDKWYYLTSSGHSVANGMYSIPGKTGADDKAIHLTDSGNQRIMRAFDRAIKKNTDMVLEFDVKKGNDCGFYVSLVSEEDLEYNADIHSPSAANYHPVDSNILIGMTNAAITGSGRSPAPYLGYASQDRAVYQLNSFRGSNSEYLQVPSDNEWHHIKLNVSPKSAAETELTVWVDNSSAYTAVTPTNFYDRTTGGVALFAHYNSAIGSNDISFDNISVYSVGKLLDIKSELNGGSVDISVKSPFSTEIGFTMIVTGIDTFGNIKFVKDFIHTSIDAKGSFSTVTDVDTQGISFIKIYAFENTKALRPISEVSVIDLR